MGPRMAVFAAALAASGPAAQGYAATQAAARFERVSHGLRSSAGELERALSDLDDLTAGYAGGVFAAESRRAELRGEVSGRSVRLWNLRDEFWELDDAVRLAQGAEAVAKILTGRPALVQAQAAFDSDSARDLGEWIRVLCDHANKALEREEAAHAAAAALRSGARRRLWGGGALMAGAGALLGFFLRRGARGGAPGPNC
ncbi:MAG: hypothetical protein HY928_06360 [Elusimicrobia bacterium]|nr:hypothetical protein [Elusimicrobiota bacterium]